MTCGLRTCRRRRAYAPALSQPVRVIAPARDTFASAHSQRHPDRMTAAPRGCAGGNSLSLANRARKGMARATQRRFFDPPHLVGGTGGALSQQEATEPAHPANRLRFWPLHGAVRPNLADEVVDGGKRRGGPVIGRSLSEATPKAGAATIAPVAPKYILVAAVGTTLVWLTYTAMRDCPSGYWVVSGAGAYQCHPWPPTSNKR